MIDYKNILQSKAVWSSIIGFLAVALKFFKVDLGDTSGLVDAIMQIVTGISFLAAAAFRITATKQLL